VPEGHADEHDGVRVVPVHRLNRHITLLRSASGALLRRVVKHRHFVARRGLAWVSERLLHLLVKSLSDNPGHSAAHLI
jgi:hypothetical protein